MKCIKSLIIGVIAICSLQVNAQWTEVEWEQTDGISLLDFVDDNVGYAQMHLLQGFTTSFEKTIDGGETWTEINLPSSQNAQIQHFDFFEEGKGVMIVRNWEIPNAVTQIYITLDDGENWVNISPEETDAGYGFAQANFLDAETGFFITGNSFYATSDGGENWFTTTLPKAATSLDFFDAMNGTVGTWDDTFLYMGGMLSTTDGGENWEETTLTVEQSVIGKVIQTDETTAYAAPAGWGSSGQQEFYKTINNGLNWTTVEVPETPNNAGLEAFDFRDELNGVVALSYNDEISMFATENGGDTWIPQNEFSEFYLSVLDLTPNSGYLSGNSGDIFRLNAPLSVGNFNVANFNLYPNPVETNQTLFWETTEVFSSVSIIDIAGKVVYQNVLGQSQQLNVPNLTSGIYFVNLQNDDSSQVVKLVIE